MVQKRYTHFTRAAILAAVVILLCGLTLTAQASNTKTYTVAAGEYLEMTMEDLSNIVTLNYPYVSYYYGDFSVPTDGTHTAVLENYYEGTWHTMNFVGGWLRLLTLIPDGLVRFKATAAGVYTFNVQVSDDDNNDYPVRVIEVTVTSPNIAPSFVGSSTDLNVAESSSSNSAVSLLHVSDTDAGQTLTWTQATAPSHGSLTISGATASSGSTDITPGGTIAYTPTAGYSGSDSFTVQVSDGTATVSRTINVTVIAKPVITGISPSSGLTAGGTVVTITGSDFSSVIAVKFGSTNAASYTVDSATQITATAPAGTAGTVHIIVTTGGGISASSTADEFTYSAPAAPDITGDTALSLKEGYTATSTAAYTITGTAPVTVTKTSGNAAITWNDTTKKLDIAAGLTEGSYPVALKASNGTSPDDTLTFTLTVTTAPDITGDTALNLTVGYSATSTSVYTITGTAPVIVTKTSGDAKITWNDTTKKLDIAAGLTEGSYPVALKASNGTSPDDTLTFTLTVTTAPDITGDTALNLTVGYSATSTNVYTITGTTPVTVIKISGNAAITWNDTTKKLDIADGLAVGSYPVVLQASNGTLPNDSLTFTLTVAAARTIQIVEVSADIPSPSLVNVSENGSAFSQSVDVRIQTSTSAGLQIAEALRSSTGRTDITDLNILPLDISVYLAGTDTRVQPNAGTSITLILPVPAQYLSQLANLVIASVSDGNLEILQSEIITVNGVTCVRFTATHFSPYAFITATSSLQVITGAASNIGLTTVTLDAGVTTGGTATVTERGFAYSTYSSFASEHRTKAGSGAGNFSSKVSGLDPFTTYYVRAYAVSAGNTVYGNTVQFATYDMAGSPKTGDGSNPWLWLALGGASAIGVGALLIIGKRKRCVAVDGPDRGN